MYIGMTTQGDISWRDRSQRLATKGGVVKVIYMGNIKS